MSIEASELKLIKVDGYKTEPFVNLQQLYEFEFSPITGDEVNDRGLYDQEKIRAHWSKAGTEIYVLYNKVLPIGFAVVNLSGMLDGDTNKRDIAEFFVMPRYRKQGAGEWMAQQVFCLYKGKWEVRQLPGLDKARNFWLKTISIFTKNDFKEIELHNEQWHGTVQMFEST